MKVLVKAMEKSQRRNKNVKKQFRYRIIIERFKVFWSSVSDNIILLRVFQELNCMENICIIQISWIYLKHFVQFAFHIIKGFI